MSLRSGLACILAVAFLASGIAAGVDPGVAPQPAAAAEIEYDSTLLRIDVQEDGTADWTIEYRVNLDDENATEAFESLRDDIRANRSEFETQFATRMNRTARAAENATGREMSVRNVSVDTDRDEIQQVGIVAYDFAWANFAVVDGDELRAGDAVSGLLLDPETTLFFSWPDTYGAVDVTPAADERSDGSATWFGREAFANDEPRLVLERGAAATTPDEEGLDVFWLGLGAVGLLGLAAAAWYVWRRRDGTVPGVMSGGKVADDTGDETADEETGAPGSAGGHDAESPPEELLSNEERVLRLLSENGGRMKQQRVVQELGWTDAKTSQVVGDLREDGSVEVFRIGRENVLVLPGESDFP